MNREILFRGKRVDNGDWIEGYFLVAAGMTFISVFGVRSPIQVDCDTVGQYTGLTDKNGERVFEGDILKCSNNSIYIVEWDKVNARFLGFTVGTKRYITYVGREPKSEVIGNIHDNLELLEV